MLDSPVNFSHWHTEPALIGGLLFVAWVYAILVGPFRNKICADLPYSGRHTLWFSAGLVSFYLAVGSPLDPLGENFLFFAHMIQHNVLMYVSPLFILLGIPQPIVDRFLETHPLLESILRFFLHPVIAGLLFTLVFSFWHFGTFYEAAIQNKTLHMAEHLSMFLTSFAMWWPIASQSKQLPPIRYGPQMLFILALMLGQTPIFAVLTFSKEVLYDTYFYAERIIDITPLEDQRSGGVVMKIANLIVSVSVLGSIFYRWSKQR